MVKPPRELSNAIPDREIPHWSGRMAGRYLRRALVLRCPVCGQSPIFPPVRRVRGLYDWFTPLDGCPRCGYAYEREPGYFLLAIWAVNYGAGAFVGMAAYLVLEYALHASLTMILVGTIVPVAVFNVLIARHAKAVFLAVDHFCDPEAPRRAIKS